MSLWLDVDKYKTGGGELTAVDRWPNSLGALHARIARCFLRPEARERARCYLAGLLGRGERKNRWQVAEQMGESGPQGAQRLLNAARWDADAVRDATCANTSPITWVTKRAGCW